MITWPLNVFSLARPTRKFGSCGLVIVRHTAFDIYAATIRWDGRPRNILVEAADTDALVGMALPTGYHMHIQVAPGGSVIIEALS